MAIEDAVAAIKTGDAQQLRALLDADRDLVGATLPGNERSLLHHATDWPGHWPNVGETIKLLISFGADPNVGFPSDSPKVAETPLHWAASSNDVVAARELLTAGAVVDALGGIFGGCTPFEEAIIFEQYDVARLLLEHGATNYLPGAAALGLAAEIPRYFDADGTVDVASHALPNWDPLPSPQIVLDRAFQFACRSGHVDIAERLLERGADPSAITPAGTSARDEAQKNGHDRVVEWLDQVGGQVEYEQLRYDDIRQKSTHNAFQRREGLYDQILYWRVRSLEVDLRRCKPILGPIVPRDWFVYHEPLDPESSVQRFSDVLRICRGVQRTLPRHEVITLFVDMKEPFDTTKSASHSGQAMDDLLDRMLGRHLYRPQNLLDRSAGAGTLREAVRAEGWPTLVELQGKFIVVLTGSDDDLATYAGRGRTVNGSTCFLSARIRAGDAVPASPDVVFYNMDATNVRAATAVRDAGLVSRSYYVDDRSRWERALRHDCHHIATDMVNVQRDPWSTTEGPNGFPFQVLRGPSTSAVEGGEVCGIAVESGDIWGQQDSFLYHYHRCVEGGCNNTYEFAVSGPNSHVDDWAKGGIIARANLQSRGAYFGVFRVGEKHGVRIQYRAGTNGSTEAIERQIGPQGRFEPDTLVHLRLRLSRGGHRARAWGSVNGEAWTSLGSYDFDVPLEYQGIGASSHGNVGGVKFLFFVPRDRERPGFDRTRFVGPSEPNAGRSVDWDGEQRWRVRNFAATPRPERQAR